MKMMAVKGNATTTGGVVLDGDATFLDGGKAIARHLGSASCSRCGKDGLIFGTASTFCFSGTHGVCDGDIVMCNCPHGTNRVIARSTTYYCE
jgi:uncharacterized Zn-binding protein involved in type VI secretion